MIPRTDMTFLYIISGLILICAVLFGLWVLLIMPGRGKQTANELKDVHFFAHRGLHDKPRIPENSLAAFSRAKENGLGSELDVHLCKDGKLIVMHDESLKRTCSRDLMICELTADELKGIFLEGTEEKIPLLSEVLALYSGDYPLIIELKPYRGNHKELTDAAVKMLRTYNGRYCIESFDPRVLLRLKKTAPHIVRGQLSARLNKGGAKLFFLVNFILSNMLANFFTQPDFIAYNICDIKCASLRLIKKLYHPPLFYWTVRSKSEQSAAEKDGGAIIFENFDPRN